MGAGWRLAANASSTLSARQVLGCRFGATSVALWYVTYRMHGNAVDENWTPSCACATLSCRPIPDVQPWDVQALAAWAKQKAKDMEHAASSGVSALLRYEILEMRLPAFCSLCSLLAHLPIFLFIYLMYPFIFSSPLSLSLCLSAPCVHAALFFARMHPRQPTQ